MPKIKVCGKAFIKSLPGGTSVWDFHETSNSIVCTLCLTRIDFIASNYSYRAKSHFESGKHIKQLEISKARQQLLSFSSSTPENNFFKELTRAFIASNIPLWKLNNEPLKKFLQSRTGQNIPNHTTLRNSYIPVEFGKTMEKIKVELFHKDINIMMDETTDLNGRHMVGVLMGDLSSLKPPFLVELSEVEKTDNVVINQLSNSSLMKIFGNNVPYNPVRLFLSDGASYMLKSARDLKHMFPNLLHITCLAHGLNRVADYIRVNHTKVDHFLGWFLI